MRRRTWPGRAGIGLAAVCVLVAPALAAVVVSLAAAEPALPAFPGAEGFGARTPGGRGGRVVIVRNLDDSGPGSFRDAVSGPGPRIVLFAVGGLITLASPIEIREPFLTVAGQTAPGDGICFRGSQVSIRTHDVVVRHLRFRPGDLSKAEVDGLDIMGDSHDVVVDHCSATWAIDENLSPSGAIRDVTVQWSVMAEGLNHSVHSKGAHGYGSLVRAAGGVTLHHNLWAHNASRSPRLGDNYGAPPWPVFDVRNNVIYDYGEIASGMTGDHLSVNYVGNYIRPGPSSNLKRGIIVLTDTAEATYYVRGNVVDGRAEWTSDNSRLFDNPTRGGRRLVELVNKAFEAPPVRTTGAEIALFDVLEGAGATRPHRDVVDLRIAGNVEARGGSVIDSQSHVGGWPNYRNGPPQPDSDNDGMPDDWEREHRLDPGNPADATAVSRKGGYTNIEIYLNELSAAPMGRGNARKR